MRAKFVVACALLVASCQTMTAPALNPARFCVAAEPITDTASPQVTEHNAVGAALCGWTA